MTEKTKIWKTSILLAISLMFLMMAAVSVNAEEILGEVIPRSDDIPVDDTLPNDLTDDLVISPNPEPFLIEPYSDVINEETGETDSLVIAGKTTDQKETLDIVIPGTVIVGVIAGIAICIIIYKIKK
ncbi:hypothetical protein AYK24_02810 [Thermoplasmatales archaeon SG8-52-4]|nr:MAG: hypothetical protein AYK24_02810 [Thermoplasmatales archaeon SG8-52-4]